VAKNSVNNDDWLTGSSNNDQVTEEEGQLAIDAYQTEDEVFINAPIAGVNPHDLEIGITDEIVTIKGKRQRSEAINTENYFTQECYWGPFSRSYLLPIAVDSDNAKASLKNGILTIAIPKAEKTKTRIIKVQAGD
jgi:HSP20 family protein